MNTKTMKFIRFIRPTLTAGEHTVSVTQSVTSPANESFNQSETFYVATRAYSIDPNDVFTISPSENEGGDFSKLLPFITIENRVFPWERKIADDIGGAPVPWVALIVISSAESVSESDISISDFAANTPAGIFCPGKDKQVVTEKDEDLCHVVDIPKELYRDIMPTHEDMVYLTHARRVNLANTDDSLIGKDGDFSVVMANRFVPTGETEPLKSTVHLVSMLGVPEKPPAEYDKIRLVSLHRWNVYSKKDDSQTFQELIDRLKNNTGIMGCDKKSDVLKRCYVPKKHMTRSGEATYSLYRSPLIPYSAGKIIEGSKYTADGHLIYDPENGVFDASYAAAFQLGRLISLSRKADAKLIDTWRKNGRARAHKKQLRANAVGVDAFALCEKITHNMVEKG